MEELNFDTCGENSLNCSNMNLNFSSIHNKTGFSALIFFLQIINWVTIAIELPLILIVMIVIFFQVKKGQDAPVNVINLFVSDLIQLCCRIPIDLENPGPFFLIFLLIAEYAALVSVGSMVCISCERYLIIAMPLWYRFRRNIKTSVVVCIVVWILPLLYPILSLIEEDDTAGIFYIVVLLLPFPWFIFFLVGTITSLSAALSVPADEKRRIAAIQVVVLINYTLLYLPIITMILYLIRAPDFELIGFLLVVGYVCGAFSPLADTTLYLFSRKSILDKFLATMCSCKISNNQEMNSTNYESRSATNTETV